MKGIGGNIQAKIQIATTTSNAIGEHIKTWTDKKSITGWLDLSGGQAEYTNYDAKIQESTHIFIADYEALDSSITAESSRMVIDSKVYDILLIDNPMEMKSGSQLEFYLKFIGGQ